MFLVNVAFLVVLTSLALCIPTVRTMIDTTGRNVREQRGGDLRNLATLSSIPDVNHASLVQSIGDFIDAHYCHHRVAFLRSGFLLVSILSCFALIFTLVGYLVDAKLQEIGTAAAGLAFLPKVSYIVAIVLAVFYILFTIMSAVVLECLPELLAIVFPTPPRNGNPTP